MLVSGVVGINLRACARGPRSIPGVITCLSDFLKSFGRAAESNEFQGWCGDELRQAYKNRFLSFEFVEGGRCILLGIFGH